MSGLLNGSSLVVVKKLQFVVGAGRRHLHDAQRADKRSREAQITHRKVFEGTLRLRAIQRRLGHIDGAQRIAFRSEVIGRRVISHSKCRKRGKRVANVCSKIADSCCHRPHVKNKIWSFMRLRLRVPLYSIASRAHSGSCCASGLHPLRWRAACCVIDLFPCARLLCS